MTEKQFRKRWLRWHSQYEKIVFRKLMKNFREAGNSIPFNFINKDNYEVLIRQSLSTDKMISLYADFYREVGIIHAKRVGKEINKETKDFTLNAFLSNFERNIIGWLYENSLSNIESVKGTYINYLKNLFIKGIDENKTLREITDDITKLINKRNFYKYQALRIARTETTAAANHSSLVVSETSNLVYDKVWIATEDYRTRRLPDDAFSHFAMNGVAVPADEPFSVQGKRGVEKIMFAGDPKGSAGNIINCRCANALRPRRDENGKLIRKTY
jgi:hypothetical protein